MWQSHLGPDDLDLQFGTPKEMDHYKQEYELREEAGRKVQGDRYIRAQMRQTVRDFKKEIDTAWESGLEPGAPDLQLRIPLSRVEQMLQSMYKELLEGKSQLGSDDPNSQLGTPEANIQDTVSSFEQQRNAAGQDRSEPNEPGSQMPTPKVARHLKADRRNAGHDVESDSDDQASIQSSVGSYEQRTDDAGQNGSGPNELDLQPDISGAATHFRENRLSKVSPLSRLKRAFARTQKGKMPEGQFEVQWGGKLSQEDARRQLTEVSDASNGETKLSDLSLLSHLERDFSLMQKGEMSEEQFEERWRGRPSREGEPWQLTSDTSDGETEPDPSSLRWEEELRLIRERKLGKGRSSAASEEVVQGKQTEGTFDAKDGETSDGSTIEEQFENLNSKAGSYEDSFHTSDEETSDEETKLPDIVPSSRLMQDLKLMEGGQLSNEQFKKRWGREPSLEGDEWRLTNVSDTSNGVTERDLSSSLLPHLEPKERLKYLERELQLIEEQIGKQRSSATSQGDVRWKRTEALETIDEETELSLLPHLEPKERLKYLERELQLIEERIGEQRSSAASEEVVQWKTTEETFDASDGKAKLPDISSLSHLEQEERLKDLEQEVQLIQERKFGKGSGNAISQEGESLGSAEEISDTSDEGTELPDQSPSSPLKSEKRRADLRRTVEAMHKRKFEEQRSSAISQEGAWRKRTEALDTIDEEETEASGTSDEETEE